MFTDHWSCVAEAYKEKEDEYGVIVDKEPKVQATCLSIEDNIDCIRNAMIKGGASTEEISAFGELVDESVVSLTDMISHLNDKANNDLYIAFQIGLFYSKLHDANKVILSKRKDLEHD